MNAMDGRVVTISPGGGGTESPKSFQNMQGQMESELEKRRKDWEHEVLKMQEDFFKIKVNENQNNANNQNVNKTVDIQVPPSGIQSIGPSGPVTEIANPKTSFEEKQGGNHVVKFQFDMRGFDPRAISVRAEGAKLLVSAKLEQELVPGNKSMRQFTRQVDIPPNVNSDDFISSMASDGTLLVEAPMDPAYSPPVEPPAYPAIEDDEVYYVTRTEPKEHHYAQIHQSSPFPTDRYNQMESISPRPSGGGSSYYSSSNVSRSPQHVIQSVSPRPSGGSSYYSSSSVSRSPQPAKMTRYFSDYHDPGPMYPHSRGDQLRHESPKAQIHHTPIPRVEISLGRDSPSRHRSSISSTMYRDEPDHYLTSSYNQGPDYRSRAKSLGSGSLTSSLNKPPPRVTIIREYETNGSGTDTATSPTTKTSLFEEFNTSPRQRSPSYPSVRERRESTSSGERIITPTKYKKHKSMSMSSDSESSFSTSPPAKEIIPRTLFPFNKEMHVSNNNGFRSPTLTSPMTSPLTSPLTSMTSSMTSNNPNVITTDEGQRLKMQIDIGNNFTPDEVTIHLRYKKVVIRAVHENTIDGRSSRSEFSKEFELPGPLEPSTLKAVLNNNGRLFIGGSLMTNRYHQQVLDLVLCDMPTSGKACNVKY